MYIGLVLASGVVAFHWLANDSSLYWVFRWLDIPVHMAGGFIASLGFIWLVATVLYLRYTKRLEAKKAWFWGILGALVIGILWEFLEAAYGLSGLRGIHMLDTIADIFNDTIGGIFGILFWRYLSR
jgi:Na+/melibiose symporter-like transporter